MMDKLFVVCLFGCVISAVLASIFNPFLGLSLWVISVGFYTFLAWRSRKSLVQSDKPEYKTFKERDENECRDY